MGREFVELVEATPIIAAVKDDEGLDLCLKSDIEIVFILYGNICTIPEIVSRIKDAGRTAMVHIDLIGGLSSKEISVDFISQYTRADGIITTKSNLIARARRLGLNTILRYFILDSMALVNIEKQSRHDMVQPDLIEILPGVVLPKTIRHIREISSVPIICGGLIRDKEEVMNALDGGAIAISTTNRDVWFL